MSSASVNPMHFLKSTIDDFMLYSADKQYDFIFQLDLGPAHTAKGTKSWFRDRGVTVGDWPVNCPDLRATENLWAIVKRKIRDIRNPFLIGLM